MSGMKHSGTHRGVAMHGFGRNTGSRHKFQALVLEGCQGEIILLTVRKCRMVCNLCCLVYYFVVSFFRGLWRSCQTDIFVFSKALRCMCAVFSI